MFTCQVACHNCWIDDLSCLQIDANINYDTDHLRISNLIPQYPLCCSSRGLHYQLWLLRKWSLCSQYLLYEKCLSAILFEWCYTPVIIVCSWCLRYSRVDRGLHESVVRRRITSRDFIHSESLFPRVWPTFYTLWQFHHSNPMHPRVIQSLARSASPVPICSVYNCYATSTSWWLFRNLNFTQQFI